MYSQFELEDIRKIATNELCYNCLKNKTILISGGTGFIGSFLIEVLKYRNEKFNDNIKIISLSRRGGESDNNIKRISCDITKEINITEDVDYIIHLASNTHPKQYAEDPVGTITTNILGCNNLLELGVKKNVSKFLLASSVEIYGQGPDYAMDEKYCGYIDCNQSRSGYNEAKRLSESLCQSYAKQYGISFSIARFARVFGPDKKDDSKAISQFLNKAINNEDIILKSEGKQLYSFCYIADAVSGLLKVLVDGEQGEAYNISDDFENMTLGDYAKYIANLANKNVVFNIVYDDSASKATYAIMDTAKIKKIGWEPLYKVSDALERTYIIKKNN